jgi:endonuclease/exonuclease/phosphatase family metal-dependent hydrolase
MVGGVLGRCGALALPLALAAGCATARNYDDPAAPIYRGGSAALKAPGQTLRVVTFNLKWGRAVDQTAELLQHAGPLRDADLIVLQEMDRSGTERLARALGYEYVYVPSALHPVPQQDFGVALLSPWRLEDGRKLLLPHHNVFRKLRRSAAVATLRSPLGPVRVYGIHFESPAAALSHVRRDQARAVLADAEGWSGLALVAGDFNGRGGPRELAKAGFGWPTESIGSTAGPFAFDHIVARGLCAAGPAAAGVAAKTSASDHKPVWAVLAPCIDTTTAATARAETAVTAAIAPGAATAVPPPPAPARSGSHPASRSAS